MGVWGFNPRIILNCWYVDGPFYNIFQEYVLKSRKSLVSKITEVGVKIRITGLPILTIEITEVSVFFYGWLATLLN